MNPLQKEFFAVFSKRFSIGKHRFNDKGVMIIEIEAKNPVVGPLVIWINKYEITVVLNYFHQHFDDSFAPQGATSLQQYSSMANACCDFIASMLKDNIVITFVHL